MKLADGERLLLDDGLLSMGSIMVGYELPEECSPDGGVRGVLITVSLSFEALCDRQKLPLYYGRTELSCQNRAIFGLIQFEFVKWNFHQANQLGFAPSWFECGFNGLSISNLHQPTHQPESYD